MNVPSDSPLGKALAAMRTLTGLGYTWEGGTHWKPPLGAFNRGWAFVGEYTLERDPLVARWGTRVWVWATDDFGEYYAAHEAMKITASDGKVKYYVECFECVPDAEIRIVYERPYLPEDPILGE